MDCTAVERLLSPFLDGELARSEREAVAAHLRGCASCQRQFETLARITDLCYSAAPPEPSPQAWERISENLAKIPAANGRAGWSRQVRWLAASIALLALIGAGWAALHWGGGEAIWNSLQLARDSVNLPSYVGPKEKPIGKPVAPDDLCDLVCFRTIKVSALPHNFKLKTCTIEPDCVVRYTFGREGDNSECIVLLYKCCHPVIHGDKQVLDHQIDGKPVKLSTCKQRLVISWHVNDTGISLVGPSDLREQLKLMEFIDAELAAQK
jgi:Putative zinc-finger